MPEFSAGNSRAHFAGALWTYRPSLTRFPQKCGGKETSSVPRGTLLIDHFLILVRDVVPIWNNFEGLTVFPSVRFRCLPLLASKKAKSEAVSGLRALLENASFPLVRIWMRAQPGSSAKLPTSGHAWRTAELEWERANGGPEGVAWLARPGPHRSAVRGGRRA